MFQVARALRRDHKLVLRGFSLARRRSPQSASFTPLHRCFSPEDASEDTTKQLFPWRHSQHLVPRVEMDMLRSRRSGWKLRLAWGIMERGAAVMMDKPFAELVGSEWRKDLAEDGAWAFTAGMATLLSNVFKVPIDDLLERQGGDIELIFAYTTPYETATLPFKESSNAADLNAVDSIFEDEYIKLFKAMYQKSHTPQSTEGANPNPLEITLTVKPITGSANLSKLFCFPFLSREAVKEDPRRKEAYLNMMPTGQTNPVAFTKQMFAFGDQMLVERGVMQTTAVAEVIVVCNESFQVKDLTTNEILQGDGQERIAQHVVRMEMDIAIEEADGQGRWIKGNWRIADIDDMVGPRDWWVPGEII